MTNQNGSTPLLEVNNLKKHFPIYSRGVFRRKYINSVKAVDGVNFTIGRAEVLGLVGESGCGKTTTGRVILRALSPTEGKIIFQDADKGEVDLAQLDREDLRDVWRNIQLIFQDPYSSLNPRMTLEEIVGEPLRNYDVAQRVGTARPRGRTAAAGWPAPGIHVALPACFQWRPAPAYRCGPRPGA